MSERLCRWKCTRKTSRRCGICLQCCDERDEHNKRLDAGTTKHIPPTERPGHRFYVSPERKAARSTRRKGESHENDQYSLATGGRRSFQCMNVHFSVDGGELECKKPEKSPQSPPAFAYAWMKRINKPRRHHRSGRSVQNLTRRQSPYEVDVHASGVPTQAVTLLQPLANWLPMFVFLIATQKTKATRTTIRVYSTKPWPSSSTKRRFRSSMNYSPPSRSELVNMQRSGSR